MTSATKPPLPLPVESQADRRLKYGLNVAAAILIAIGLAAAFTWAAERKPKRVDTTAAGLYSLKPQTINIIQDNKQKFKITSLYTKAKPPQSQEQQSEVVAAQDPAYEAEKVSDLLEEYKTKGKNIEVEEIDPVASPAKVEDLINEVTKTYGGEVAKYDAFTKTYPQKYKAITDMAEAEAQRLEPLASEKSATEDVKDFVSQVGRSIRELPKQLKLSETTVNRALKQKPPNYKGVTDSVQDNVSVVSSIFGQVIDQFKTFKDDKKVPDAIRKYMTDSLPRYEDMKKAADDLLKEASSLGELKLDTLREALKLRNPILIRGEKEWKVLSYSQVWRKDNRDVQALRQGGAQIRPRFAGEQMISAAIVTLNQPKKVKVVFVRGGGPPVSQSGFPPFQPDGAFSAVAERLRDYNFDVLDKDLTGMWAMQQQQQQMPSAPEPADADIKDAIWVVIDSPSAPSQFGPPPTIAPKIHEHLVNGGSALIVAEPRADDLAMALGSFGITLVADAVSVHELIKTEGAAPQDMVEEAQKVPYIFAIRDWGDHMLTRPLRSLQGILVAAVPVRTKSAKDVTVTPLIPLPDAPSAPKSWGEKDLDTIDQGSVKFDPEKDIPGPLYAGATAEKATGQRLVVFGAASMISNNIVNFPDQELRKRGILAARFPGNGEVFMNSLFWLSHQEPMIAISPAAMDISRIGEMSNGAQRFWRVGVLLIGLPGAVILAGALVFLARRD